MISTISFADYLVIDAVNHSRLKRFAESPWHYQNVPKPKKPSADFIFGTQFHALLLEPAYFAQHYVEAPVMNKNNGDWKKLVAATEANKQELIDMDNLQRLRNMREAVMADQYAAPLFVAGLAEQTIQFNDEATGLPCKARIDWLPDGFPNVLVDLKTTRNANPKYLCKSSWEYGYHTQAAFYSMAWETETGVNPDFLFVFCEKPDDPEDTPLPPQIYELDRELLKAGQQQIRQWLDLVKQCLDEFGANPWPHYTTGLSKLTAPAWAKLGD